MLNNKIQPECWVVFQTWLPPLIGRSGNIAWTWCHFLPIIKKKWKQPSMKCSELGVGLAAFVQIRQIRMQVNCGPILEKKRVEHYSNCFKHIIYMHRNMNHDNFHWHSSICTESCLVNSCSKYSRLPGFGTGGHPHWLPPGLCSLISDSLSSVILKQRTSSHLLHPCSICMNCDGGWVSLFAFESLQMCDSEVSREARRRYKLS